MSHLHLGRDVGIEAIAAASAATPCDARAVTDQNRSWRLLLTEPADGATNMAIDEALWLGRRAATSPPTVRFFAWAPPTVSLGCGQPLDDHVDVAVCRRLGVGLVRRPTGGSAIYHDGPERELTYSVVAAAEDIGGGARDLLHSYQWIGRALAAGLRGLGAPVEMMGAVRGDAATPAFCFARTGSCEIEVSGRKLVGSAQRRYGSAFLQHGSILLAVDAEQLRAIFPTTADPLATLTTLEVTLGHRPKFDDVAAALAGAFAAEHGIDLRPDGLSADEVTRAERLVREKYATDNWLRGRA
jgi:lipoyl(octanoyl) transferase